MNNILVTMVIAGHNQYFKFADMCIPSFIKNCPTTKMLIYTDKIDFLLKYKNISNNIEILDFNKYFKKANIKNIKSKKLYNMVCDNYNDTTYNHEHIFVAAVLPMSQEYALDKNGIDYILKIDCDGFFAGGDIFKMLKNDISKYPDYDLFLIERKNLLMGLNEKNLPGVGFTLWKKTGKFIDKYNKYFNREEQETILKITDKVKTKFLERPGYHFVFPFQKDQPNIEYTKEQLEEFLPAYFHIHEQKHFDMLLSWFK
jgi:hypothetical protein